MSLGKKLANFMNQFIDFEPALEDYITLSEGGDAHWQYCNIQIDFDNFQQLAQENIIGSIQRGEIPCFHGLMEKFVLERLGDWKPWGMLQDYLKGEGVEIYLVFKNEPVDGLYPVEIRAFPTVLA